jgi:outer membrane receptor protein involved in Fe transport
MRVERAAIFSPRHAGGLPALALGLALGLGLTPSWVGAQGGSASPMGVGAAAGQEASPAKVSAEAETEADLTTIPFEKLLQTDVVTASRLARQLSDSPAAVSIVTADEIRTHGYRTLAEVLSSMRGLYVTNDYRYDYLGGRGFGAPGDYSGRMMVLIDGFAAQDNLYGQIYIDNSALLDLDLIDRVEFVPGTGSAIYGNGAFLGIVNIITKNGRDFGALRLGGELSSFGGWQRSATLGKTLGGGIDLLVSATQLGSPGQDRYFPFFDAVGQNGGQALGQDRERGARWFGKLRFDTLTLEAAQSHRIKSSPLPRRGNALNRVYQMDDLSRFVSGQWDQDLGGPLKGQLLFYVAQYQDRFLEEWGVDDPPDQYIKGLSNGRWWGLHQKLTYTGFRGHSLLLGAEYRDDTQQRLLAVGLDNQFQRNDIVRRDRDWKQRIISLYLTDEVRFGPRWSANLGARIDKTLVSNCTPGVCAVAPYPERFSPRAALIWNPQSQTTVKFSHSVAFRLPTVNEQYSTWGRFALPERLATQELAVIHDLTPRLRLTGSAYRLGLRDVYFVSTDTGEAASDGKPSNRGVEFQWDQSWEWGARLKASAAIQSARDAQGSWPSNVPRSLARVSFSAPWVGSIWRCGVEAAYLGRRQTSPVLDSDDTLLRTGQMLGGVTLAHLTLSHSGSWKGWRVSAGAKNLFNRRYEVVSPKVFDDGDQVLDSIAADGRVLWLRASWDWGL